MGTAKGCIKGGVKGAEGVSAVHLDDLGAHGRDGVDEGGHHEDDVEAQRAQEHLSGGCGRWEGEGRGGWGAMRCGEGGLGGWGT